MTPSTRFWPFLTIRVLKDQLKLFDKAIQEQMKVIPNTLTSVKGFGPVYASGILAEIGDTNCFKNQAALASLPVFAGVNINPASIPLTILI